MTDYFAFISYAHRDKAWVRVLQENLERCLQGAGRPGKVFLDEIDLASGRSWVGQLEAGLSCSDQIVLVATPEAMASPRVADEWRSFVATRSDWHLGKLHIVQLVEVPLPPFLAQIQFVDFRETDEARYRQALQELAGGLLGHSDNRNLPPLPEGIKIPPPLMGRLPASLRSRLVAWLARVFAKKALRLAVASRLSLKAERLEDQGSWECAASASLVWVTREEEPVTAALRIVDTLRETLDEDEPNWVELLTPLREELAALQAESPQRGLLTLWLQSVARDHEQLVPLQEQVALGLLDRVYVQLQIHPGGYAGAVTEEVRLLSSLTLPNLLSLDRSEHPWVTGRWIVLGAPGAGKTTLLRHLTATLAGQEGQPWVPLFDSLPRLLRDNSSPFDRAVRRLEYTSRQRAQELAETLERISRDGRLLLLLDGLDEVPREAREDAEKLLRDLSKDWPRSPLVATSRPIGYRPPGSEFREVEILPLDRDHRRELLARFLGRAEGSLDTARAEQALQSLEAAAELGEIAGNPLYLTLMALLFEQQGIAPANRPHLYDQVFDLLLDGKYRPGVEPMERKAVVRSILRELACGMTEDNRDSESVADLEERLYRPAMETLRENLGRTGRWRRMRRFLLDLGEQTGILGPYEGEAADWRFWHRTFREALTAEYLWEKHWSAAGQAAVLARAREITAEEDQRRWAEPFALLAERVQDPDGFVKTLAEANLPLGLQVLASTQRLHPETVREILASSEKWEERAEVYRRLPEQVGKAQRCLGLLDQLRRQTRSGNDLYFLEEAAREVARRFPEHAWAAEALLAKIYDHIPSPPEELFRWVETPHDGKVPLWREISAGSFLMGSLADESSWDDERPRHEVRITGPFLCAVVPVTNAQYAVFDPEHRPHEWGGVTEEELSYHPVGGVTWFEAVSFCRWLSVALPFCRGARLPFEQEWEYACRAGSKSRYWSGDAESDLAAVGWYAKNADGRTHRVGEKPANPWGLYDVHGNVWEWTLSPSSSNSQGLKGGIESAPKTVEVPAGEAHGGWRVSHEGRVLCGGSYWNNADRARSAFRDFDLPGFMSVLLGFRVVLPAFPGASAGRLRES